MSRKNKGILAGGAAILLVGAGLLVRARNGEPVRADEATTVSTPVPVRLITVGDSNTPRWLEATGTARAQLEAPIATKVQGRVMQVFVREGDRVRRGQPLIALDARDLDAGVSQAEANRRAAVVGYDNARVAATMEASTSAARIAGAQAQVKNAEAALQAARARLALVQSGPRPQEKAQAGLAVAQAQSSLTLAETNLRRMRNLVAQGAAARQQQDLAQSQYEVAKAQYDSAVQGQSIAEEGSRQEDIRGAQEAVRQAEAGLNEARAGLKQAQAAALQVNVRRQQIRGAEAQIGQSQAAVQMAQVTRDYATISAPFDGIVTKRLADPGALASPGVPLLTIQGGPIRLEAVLPEGALGAARKGAAVPVSLDALPGKDLSGRISEVAPQGDAGSHTFLVKVDLPASLARSGMFGRARFRTGTARGLFVPRSAVVQREGLSYVFTVDNGNQARLRLVTVGDVAGGVAGDVAGGASGNRLPVLSGLNAGERVIADADKVSDGSTITPEGRA